jgi:aspartate kinase
LPRIVMKFGGTSMAGIERIRHVAGRVRREVEAGSQVLVVVSAMAGETDRLVQLCREAAALHDPSEYDVVVASGEQVTAGLLAMTLQGMGLKARIFMGWQLVRASGVHGNARVDKVERALLDEALAAGTVCVIPGFQGVSDDGRVARVDFYRSPRVLVASDTEAPFEAELRLDAAGAHQIIAEVHDDAGAWSTSRPVVVTAD